MDRNDKIQQIMDMVKQLTEEQTKEATLVVLAMRNNRPEIDRYVLTEMDEEGNVWCEYSGKNNFSFHTMTDLLVSFRVFRIAMHVLAFMFGQVVYKLLSQLF